MTDYTPSEQEVREHYAEDHRDRYGSRLDAADGFDRWLAAHDAEVRASFLAEQGEPLDAIQWRMVNHSQVRQFLGDAWIGKLNKASRIVLAKHHAHEITFHECADGTGPQLYAPLNSYIIRTGGRFTVIDGEIYERLTRSTQTEQGVPEWGQVFIQRYGMFHASFGGIGGDAIRLDITRDAWKAMGEPNALNVSWELVEENTPTSTVGSVE